MSEFNCLLELRKAVISVFFLGIHNSIEAETVLEGGMGSILVNLPTYPGSADQSTYVLPLPYIFYKDDNVTIDREGLIGNLFESEKWHLDISLSAGIPVNSSESSARLGMPDLDWTIEAGPRLLYYLSRVQKRSDYIRGLIYLRKAMSTDISYINQIGWKAGLGIEMKTNFTIGKNSKLTWTNNLTMNWASKDYLDYYYTVHESYANVSRPEFSSSSGYASTTISSGFVFKYKQLQLTSFVSYQNFSGSQSIESPLVERNSNLMISTGIVWILSSSRW